MTLTVTLPATVEPTRDRDLVQLCLAGHPDEFRHLIRRYERVVTAHLRLRLGCSDAIDDAAQETFVRAYLNLAKLRSSDAFFSWLLGIADRVAREWRRRQGRQKELSAAYLEEERRARTEPRHDERDAELESALASLSEPLRQVVMLRFYADRSCADIAQALGIPIGTVTKRLSRAYDHIRRHIERREVRS